MVVACYIIIYLQISLFLVNLIIITVDFGFP